MNVKDPGSRLLRCRIQLAEHNYDITYRRESQNTNADALSRIGSVSKEGDLSDVFDEDRKIEVSLHCVSAYNSTHRYIQI